MLNVLVTGGSRGLGLGIARRLATVGYGVIAIARHESEQLAVAIREHEQQGSGFLNFRPFDLASCDAIQGFVKQLHAEFGPIYGLVNNASIGTSGFLTMMSNRQIRQLIDLNIVSPVVLTKYVVRAMMATGGGRIVNIASIVAFTGYRGLTVYGATKASIIGFTRSLAREVGALGVTVNAVAPGFVDTDMTQALSGQKREQIIRRSALVRLAEVSDIASAVEFLLSEKARNITGTVMTVDAGNTA
jgi:3-oxoacyl-[acyl-carrier protein] reductase